MVVEANVEGVVIVRALRALLTTMLNTFVTAWVGFVVAA
jgi:hypothetical protein